MPQSNSVTKALSFHPLDNVTNAPVPLIDPALEGFAPLDPGISGLASGGKTDLSSPRTSRVINHAGLQDMAGTASYFGHGIAAGLLGAEAAGAAGGAESVGADLEAAGTSAPSAGSSAPRVAQVQSSSLQGNAGTDTLGSSGSQMPPATPEPAGGPTAPGGSAAPNATMPAAIPEPAGGPTAPGGSAYQAPDATQPASTQQDQNNQKQPSTTKTVLDSLKTASQILGPASTLFAAAAGVKASKQAKAQSTQAPPPPPPPPTLPVFGSGKGALSAPVVERSIIHDQATRRGRQSTILTNDQNDRLGG